MDDLLREFVVETTENIDVVDNELVRFEQDPNNKAIIAQIFRLVHTIKGTCGFLGLPRLEALTHAAETAIDKFRDGAPVTRDAVSLILSTIDRIKVIMAELDRSMAEPTGEDGDLIEALEALWRANSAQPDMSHSPESVVTDFTVGSLTYQVLERPLRPGEVSLDDLEQAFRETHAEESEFDAQALQKAGLADHGPHTHHDSLEMTAAQEAAAEVANSDAARRNNSIRVPVDTLEHLMTMVSELVLTRNQLMEISRRDENSAFKVPLQRLSHVTAELQESVMKTRMQPIGTAWAKLPRLVRDLCEDLGKELDLEMNGADTEIDRQLLDLVKDPMLHMIRNAADHGIERPYDRVKAGKSVRGMIRVSAAQEGGYITLSIADDGRGLDLPRIRAKIVSQGLALEADVARMNDQQVARYIFQAGFSTAEKVTNVSGRGVGMDVVRNNIEQMGGSINVRTEAGKGTTVDIKIPLTLAIAAALILESGGQRFALPQMAIIELVRPSGSNEARVEHLHSAPVLRLRERLLPLVELSQVLGLESKRSENWSDAFIVVCQVGAMKFGIVVDSVLQTEEIVVKPVSARIRHLSCYSGATILGDGSVIMILDPNGLVQHVGTVAEAHNDNAAAADNAQLLANASSTLLVFRAGKGGPKAVPLAMVTRLEEIDVARIEHSNGQRLLQYRGRLMRLIPCNPDVLVKETGTQPILVFATGNAVVGLLVDEIIDIVEDKLEMGMGGGEPGVIGSAIIHGRATDILDVAYFVPELAGHAASSLHVQRRLLLVEPSDFFRAMLGPVLQAAGFQLHQAGSAADAMRHLAAGAFDVIVANVEDHGTIALATKAGKRTLCIGLAGHASRQILESAHQAGFNDVVGQFDREGLLASIGAGNAIVGEAA